MWFYSNDNERLGPVNPTEFDQLVRSGVIKSDTLVWREGMPDWLPWSVASAQSIPPPPPPMDARPPSHEDGFADPQGFFHQASPLDDRPLHIKFTGAGGEYFRIWIVNLVLTIVTFGIYAAWAKVRTKRYFYAHTSLAGHAFEYLAEPKRILIGNLIVVGLFFAYKLAGAISPFIQGLLVLFTAVAVPWLIVKSILFNARSSAWRGLKFGFSGRYWDAAVLYVLLPILVTFTLGLIWPYIAKRRREWVTQNHRFGTTPFQFNGQTGDFYQIYLKAAAFIVPVIAAIVFGIVSTMAVGPGGFGPFMFIGAAFAFVGAMYLRARLFTYAWNNTALGPHTFVASMRVRDLIGMHLVNTLVTALTLGLAWPWAAVRMARFQLGCLQVVRGGSLDTFVGESQPQPGAIGEAAGDFLDFDIGFGV